MSDTVAPGMTPPCGSFTVPVTDAVVICAEAGSATTSAAMATRSALTHLLNMGCRPPWVRNGARRESRAGMNGEVLDRDDVDVVHLAAPVSELHDLTVAAAQAGKHILLGKPMAMNVIQADRMVDAVERAGIGCMPFQAITRLRISDLKTRIEAGEIGDIAVLHQSCRWSIAEDWASSGRAGWFADPAHVPGGAFIDEGIYWIDVFRWLAGSEITQVEGKIANLVHKDIAVEDWGFGTFTFANGVVATLEAAWTINAPRKTGPSPKQNAVVRLEIIGTRGEIIDQWFRSPGRAVLAAGAADWVFERQSEERFAATSPVVLDHLIDCLEDRAKPIATIHDARASFVAAMNFYASAERV